MGKIFRESYKAILLSPISHLPFFHVRILLASFLVFCCNASHVFEFLNFKNVAPKNGPFRGGYRDSLLETAQEVVTIANTREHT